MCYSLEVSYGLVLLKMDNAVLLGVLLYFVFCPSFDILKDAMFPFSDKNVPGTFSCRSVIKQ
jgi:hypothetical protein